MSHNLLPLGRPTLVCCTTDQCLCQTGHQFNYWNNRNGLRRLSSSLSVAISQIIELVTSMHTVQVGSTSVGPPTANLVLWVTLDKTKTVGESLHQWTGLMELPVELKWETQLSWHDYHTLGPTIRFTMVDHDPYNSSHHLTRCRELWKLN